MNVHVLGLPHLDTVRANATCAYTQKIRRLCDMLTMCGHHVTLYAGEENEADVAEHVCCVTRAQFPEVSPEVVFNNFDTTSPLWQHFNTRVTAAIRQRIEPHDTIAVTMGVAQLPVAEEFPNHLVFESGIGYEGSFANCRVFESRAWQHHTYGRQGISDGRFYDDVIPNAFDITDYMTTDTPDDYLLFLGRHIPRKGTLIIEELARKGHRIVTAGQGGPLLGCEYVGIVQGDEKAKLLANAVALLSPTTYIEPFGGVAVEAQLSATPVIATPWGAYPETVSAGCGWLCSTLKEFDAAAKAAKDGRYDRHDIRFRAAAKYALEPVSVLYDKYLERLATLYGEGWYA